MKHTAKGHAFTETLLEVFKLSGLLTAEGDRMTSAVGLTSARWKILGSLARSEGPLTVSQIARLMGQSRQAVQRLVDVMNKDGLLDLIENPNHKRARLAVLTASGKTAFEQLEQLQIPWANEKSSAIKQQDLETTLLTLHKMSRLFEG